MPVVSKKLSAAIGATNGDVLSGTNYRNPSRDWVANVYATSSVDSNKISAFVNGEEMAKDSELNSSNAYPKLNEDLIIPSIPVPKSANFVVDIKNDNAGASTQWILVVFTPADFGS